MRGRAGGAGRRRKIRRRRGALPARRNAGLRRRAASDDGHGRGRPSATRATRARTVSRASSGPLPLPRAPPVSMRSRCAGCSTTRRSSPPASRLAARHGSHREGVRVRRHARAQRRDLGAPGSIGLERRRRCLFGRRQFLSGLRARGRSGAADRKARRALRDHADRHQEMDGRLADSGAARRDRDHSRAAAVRGGSGRARCRAPGADGRRGRGQSRHPRHLPAAHGRRHAAGQDRIVQGGA